MTGQEQNIYKYCTDNNVKCGESKCENIKLCNKSNEISSGAFGKVFLCDKDDKVLKTVEKSEDIEGEIDYVKYNNSDKYKHVAEIYLPVSKSEEKLECDSIKYIVMEKVMTLDEYVKKLNKRITNVKILFDAKFLLIRKLIEALRFLHLRIGYCHNDLKPQNIGIKKINNNGKAFWIIKFIDMGASIQIKPENRDKMYSFDEGDRLYQQTLMFSCPLLLEHIQHDYYRDMWAIGCIIYYIVCEKYMIDADREPMIYKTLMNMDIDSLSYMLCIDHEDPDLKKPVMKQCINGAMSDSRKAFNEVMNSWHTQQDQIPLQQISFIKRTIFDFMYKSVAQSYENTDMYQNIKKPSQGGANATSGANATPGANAKLSNELKNDLKTKSESINEEQLNEQLIEKLKRKKPNENYKDFFIDHGNNNTDTKKDTRDVDMLRNLVYLKINATKKIDKTE